jgi:hypothetical protein
VTASLSLSELSFVGMLSQSGNEYGFHPFRPRVHQKKIRTGESFC